MNTLIISIYDGGYGGYSASVMDKNFNIVPMNLSESDMKIFDALTSWNKIKDIPQPIQKFFDKYDHIIVCNNGGIKKLQ